MQIKGKVSKILTLETGVSKAGKQWSKQSFVIDFKSGDYDKILCIDITSPKTLEFFEKNVRVGDEVFCEINVDSREYNGRYYTGVSAWKVEKTAVGSAASGNDPFAPTIDDGSDMMPF